MGNQIGGSGNTAGLAYSIENKNDSFNAIYGIDYPWTLHSGLSKKQLSASSSSVAGLTSIQQSPAVSIFKFDKKGNQNQQYFAAASNALRRCKILRHPYILQYIDGVETDSEIVIVTEPVIPLIDFLKDLNSRYSNSNDDDDGGIAGNSSKGLNEVIKNGALAWGIGNIANALSFLNSSCKLIHGNISLGSVFVTPGGDWKLGCFDITGEHKENGPPDLLKENQFIPNARYKSPERLRNDWAMMGVSEYGNPAWAIDAWSFGCVMYEVFNNGPAHNANDFLNINKISEPLRGVYRKLLAAEPRDRLDPGSITKNPEASKFFSNNFVKTLAFFDELQLKDNSQKEKFFKVLIEKAHAFPSGAIRYKMMPKLIEAIRIHANAVNATNAAGGIPIAGQEAPSATLSAVMLNLVVVLSEAIDKHEKDKSHSRSDSTNETKSAREEYATPAVVELFRCNDRATRVALLQKMDVLGEFLNAKIINEQIFDKICTGFSDSTPVLRELTIKAMMHIAPKLNETNLNETLMRHFAKLQTDPEAAIRTNTTICIGKIAPHLSVATRGKILIPVYARAMRDPFVPARVAGLKALSASQEYIKTDTVGIATKVLPQICPMLVDPSPEVRVTAFKTLAAFVKIVEDASIANGGGPEALNQSGAVPTAIPVSMTAPAAQKSVKLSGSDIGGDEFDIFADSKKKPEPKAQNRGFLEEKSLFDMDEDDLGLTEPVAPKAQSQQPMKPVISSQPAKSQTNSIGSLRLPSNTNKSLAASNDDGGDIGWANSEVLEWSDKPVASSQPIKKHPSAGTSQTKLEMPKVSIAPPPSVQSSKSSTSKNTNSMLSIENPDDFFAMALAQDGSNGDKDRNSAEARRLEAERIKEEARKRRAARASGR